MHSLRQVEGRLVARAEQVVGLLLVQRNRAADVGADLGVCNDAVVGPVFAAGGGVQLVRVQAHEQDDGLGLLVQLAFAQFVQALGDDVEGGADGDIRGLDGGAARGRGRGA